jgi:peptidoglycan/xylan/chitin deacetylase (PgdA/CDA1 family)
MQPALHVVMYHYVRDLARTPYPELKAMLVDDFRRQVDELAGRFEMATLESSLAFLKGSYQPRRDLCLLTFDDGVKEHFREVTPLLAERGIQGLFFLITGAIEDKRVAPVHMNHFLMAALGFERYRMVFLSKLAALGQAAAMPAAATVKATYPWDSPEIGAFKYLFNFVLSPPVRDRIVRELFEEAIGPEAGFSEELYVSWDEARMMQDAGMVLGGHTQEHRPLATLDDEELEKDLSQCRRLLEKRVDKQQQWPFCYPYGKKTSFDGRAVEQLKKLGFVCGFSTENGANTPGDPAFEIHRIDCNKAWNNA